jgi:plasmid stability protein
MHQRMHIGELTAVAVLTIRNLDDAVYRRLKDQARLNQRSIEAEARVILDQGLKRDREAAIREIDAIRRSLEGKVTWDTTAWLRQERDRL